MPDHRLEICALCGALFSICRSCDRGQMYCGLGCRRAARRRTARSAHRRHRRSPEGRHDHRDAERARRAPLAGRVGDHGSEKLTASGTVPAPARAPDSEVESLDAAGLDLDEPKDDGHDRPGARPGADTRDAADTRRLEASRRWRAPRPGKARAARSTRPRRRGYAAARGAQATSSRARRCAPAST